MTDRRTLPDWLVVVLLVEVGSLAIALLMPIVPSRTESSWSPASLVVLNPTYLETALAWFVFTNIAVALIGMVAWFTIWRRGVK